MTETWIADVTPLCGEETYRKYYREVPEWRRRKADRIRNRRQRAQSIGAWVLYEKAKAMCRDAGECVYNLSHSGQFVLCSVATDGRKDIKLGCDIEEIKEFHKKLMNRYFLPSEREYILGRATEEEQRTEFYRYWVLKESFMKATRYGMGLGLHTFEIQCEGLEVPRIIRQPGKIPEQFFFKEYSLDIPYKIAVCATENLFAEKIQKVEL